ncbi:hypothetical protein L6452_12021 [Arctium lappa]|uniref:Uncharacterized protein n=1 Tax=Arctium lappa TaxID=4217 RepID=A0ACB9DRC5_ARCLA|nr:hypothetical protein L6452_12021 [Arctium lappa]
MSLIQELDHLKIPLQHIKLATDDFAHHNFIGHGGFGRVYKGHLAGDQDTAVAVKRVVKELLELGYGDRTPVELHGRSLQLDNNQKLRKITVDHKDWIYSMIFTTENFNGSLHSSKRYGGNSGYNGGEISEINFVADEQITGILGTVGVSNGRHAGFTVISSLSFVTNKKTDGPFGKENGTHFSVPWDVGSFAGIYGRGGLYLDGLGCYLKGTISRINDDIFC